MASSFTDTNSANNPYFVSSENCGSGQAAVSEARKLRAAGKRAAVEYKNNGATCSSVQSQGESR